MMQIWEKLKLSGYCMSSEFFHLDKFDTIEQTSGRKTKNNDQSLKHVQFNPILVDMLPSNICFIVTLEI